ncbi:MAG: polyprenyl synthetase family protein [Firmicutes bacterium]|nr:polyprenyl synthetase family protein [Bacillota bacterium]
MGLDRKFFQEQDFDFSPSFKELLLEVLGVPGKGLRGNLLRLAAGGELMGEETPAIKSLSLGIEILHLATLIHDDLIDRGELRRGQTAVWKKWGDKTAVLLGDYLFATAYQMISKVSGAAGMKRVNLLLQEMVEAELEEEQDRFHRVSVEKYLRRIEKKTARFFQVVCELGAETAGFPRGTSLLLGEFGREIGVAFQLLDDLLDVTGEKERIGKPLFQDLKNGVLTLPLLLIYEEPDFQQILRQVQATGQLEPWMRETVNKLLAENHVPAAIWQLVDEGHRRAKKALRKLDLPHRARLYAFAERLLSRPLDRKLGQSTTEAEPNEAI